MATREIVTRRGISPTGEPENKGRRKALFSEIEDPQRKLKLVEKYWRQKLEGQDPTGTAIVDPVREERARQRKLTLATRNQEAFELATSRALGQLIVEKDEMPFAIALSRAPRRQRPAIYQTAITTSIEVEEKIEVSGLTKRTLKSLIGLDDTPGHRLSREAIKAIEETDPDMLAVAVRGLPATSLALVADEDTLGICSPRQLSTLIGMAAGRIFVEGGKPSSQSEAGAERQQRMRISMGRLLDKVVERDGAANLTDDPDFGFAEAVIGQLSAESLARMKKAGAKRPTFTVCKLVELADRKRESAAALVGLLDPKVVDAAREVIAEFSDYQDRFDEEPPVISDEDYFSI